MKLQLHEERPAAGNTHTREIKEDRRRLVLLGLLDKQQWEQLGLPEYPHKGKTHTE